jgi:alkylation response protein AidB-like acyl-CoA dehydrogenase
LSFGAKEKKLGWHSQPTAMVNFEDCRVPVANRIGEEGIGFRIAMAGLDGGRINIAACSLGAATPRWRWRWTMSTSASSSAGAGRVPGAAVPPRRHGDRTRGGPAAALQGRDQARREVPRRHRLAAMAKRKATDVGFWVVNEALQLHGGYGYLRDFPLERYLRDLRVHQILEGTNEIMRVIIARDLLLAGWPGNR